MEQLGVELILANSPQAKGRVERMNGVLQDRLVKEMRLAGINDMESANRFLDGKYLRAFNRQFARAAASPLDVHRAVPRNLNEVLSWEEERVVQGDWTVACDGKRYQLDRQHEALSLVRRKVIVRTLRNGRVQLVYRGKQLKWRVLPEGTVRKPPPEEDAESKTGNGGRAPALEPSVAAGWSGSGAEVLERDQGPGTRGAAASRLGQPGKQNNEQQPTKGTFHIFFEYFFFNSAARNGFSETFKKTPTTPFMNLPKGGPALRPHQQKPGTGKMGVGVRRRRSAPFKPSRPRTHYPILQKQKGQNFRMPVG